MTIMRNDDTPFVKKSHEREGERERVYKRETVCVCAHGRAFDFVGVGVRLPYMHSSIRWSQSLFLAHKDTHFLSLSLPSLMPLLAIEQFMADSRPGNNSVYISSSISTLKMFFKTYLESKQNIF